MLAIMLVEQHARLALQVTQSAMVLNRGRVSYFGPSGELLAASGDNRHTSEAGAGLLKRLWVGFLSLLPIEWLL